MPVTKTLEPQRCPAPWGLHRTWHVSWAPLTEISWNSVYKLNREQMGVGRVVRRKQRKSPCIQTTRCLFYFLAQVLDNKPAMRFPLSGRAGNPVLYSWPSWSVCVFLSTVCYVILSFAHAPLFVVTAETPLPVSLEVKTTDHPTLLFRSLQAQPIIPQIEGCCLPFRRKSPEFLFPVC